MNPKYSVETVSLFTAVCPQVIWVTYAMAKDSCVPSLWRTGSLCRDALPAVSHRAIAGSAGPEHRCSFLFSPGHGGSLAATAPRPELQPAILGLVRAHHPVCHRTQLFNWDKTSRPFLFPPAAAIMVTVLQNESLILIWNKPYSFWNNSYLQ